MCLLRRHLLKTLQKSLKWCSNTIFGAKFVWKVSGTLLYPRFFFQKQTAVTTQKQHTSVSKISRDLFYPIMTSDSHSKPHFSGYAIIRPISHQLLIRLLESCQRRPTEEKNAIATRRRVEAQKRRQTKSAMPSITRKTRWLLIPQTQISGSMLSSSHQTYLPIAKRINKALVMLFTEIKNVHALTT